MNFKKFIMNNKAVPPVIGVILMVAITVILAAAIGSTVFGEDTAKPAPQAKVDIQAGSAFVDGGNEADTAASVKIEHLGGDPINFQSPGMTKIMVSINGTSSETIDYSTYKSDLGVLSVGDVKTLILNKEDSADTKGPYLENVKPGSTVDIKIIDLKTNQPICDKTVRF